MKNKNAQSITTSFENIFMNSKIFHNLIERDSGKEILDEFFAHFLKKNHIQRSSRYTSLRIVFAERFNRTIGDLLKTPVLKVVMLIGMMNCPY